MYYGRRIVGLVDEWRAQAATLREYGAEMQAVALERCADQLHEGVRELESRPLTLQEASDLGGYSVDHLGRLVRQGKIPNVGRPGAPRIAREHVPIKAGMVASKPEKGQIDFKQIVRSAVSQGA
jgi:hypothetical protein